MLVLVLMLLTMLLELMLCFVMSSRCVMAHLILQVVYQAPRVSNLLEQAFLCLRALLRVALRLVAYILYVCKVNKVKADHWLRGPFQL